MSYYMYLFEAHSIQRYILNSGKLKDMVGASELLEYLLREPLDKALSQLALREGKPGLGDYEFSRLGGGAFSLVFTDKIKAQSLRDLWGLIVQGIAPGLSFNHVVTKAADSPTIAFEAAQKELQILRNYHEPMLPVAGPLVRRSPRTGQPAVCLDRPRAEDDNPEWIDESTFKKRLFSDEAKKKKRADSLDNKFLSVEDAKKFKFPLNTDTEFPLDNTRYVAILHADGNGLGNIVRKLASKLSDQEYASTFLAFSKGVNDATCAAAQEALQPVLKAFDNEAQQNIEANTDKRKKKDLPFRPLVLGGDDLTVIIRADFAFKYAEDFLRLFEKKTAAFLQKDFSHIKSMPTRMTACAGMAFIKINQPFAMGYRLAESLCDHAKNASRQITKHDENLLMPSSVVFHRVTSTTIEDYKRILPRELTASEVSANNTVHYRKTLGAYGVGSHAQNLPALDSLRKMKELFTNPEMSRGPMRHFMTLLDESIPEARKAYRRWQENMSKDKTLMECYAEYQELLATLGIDAEWELPFAKVDHNGKDEIYQSFLADLSNWIAVEGERND